MTLLDKGMDAPDIDLLDGEGKRWRLSELRGKKVILFFYPADDTPGCTRECKDFRDALPDFDKAGFVVLGVSPQGAESHRAFASKYELNFPLLVDDDAKVAEAYGVADDQGMKWGDIPLIIKRSTFVIDGNGKIEQALYGVHAKGHVEALKGTLGLGADRTLPREGVRSEGAQVQQAAQRGPGSGDARDAEGQRA